METVPDGPPYKMLRKSSFIHDLFSLVKLKNTACVACPKKSWSVMFPSPNSGVCYWPLRLGNNYMLVSASFVLAKRSFKAKQLQCWEVCIMKISTVSSCGKQAAEWHEIAPACLLWSQSPGYCSLKTCQLGWHSWCSWLLHWSCVCSMAACQPCDFTVSFKLLKTAKACYYSNSALSTLKYSKHYGQLVLYLFILSQGQRQRV